LIQQNPTVLDILGKKLTFPAFSFKKLPKSRNLPQNCEIWEEIWDFLEKSENQQNFNNFDQNCRFFSKKLEKKPKKSRFFFIFF